MKRLFSLLLVLALVLAVFPVYASAQAAEQLQVNTPTFYDSGAVRSVTASFVWKSESSVNNTYLILSTKELEGGKGPNNLLTYGGFGDFADKGNIALIKPQINSYEEAKTYNDTHDNCFEFVHATSTGTFHYGQKYTVNMQFDENTIPLGIDDTYYLYLWITDINDKFYPDNLICVFNVKDGVLKWTPAIVPSGYTNEIQNYYRNYFDSSKFTELTTGIPRDVTVTSNGEYMTTSDDETQTGIIGAISPITYTAIEGYYFPETYTVTPQNGIMVKRLNERQIMVYGTPTADVTFQLYADPVKLDPNNPNNPSHTHQPSDWKSDETYHWYYTCLDPNCSNTSDPSVSGYGKHVYDNDYDTVCNTCNYTRTAPAERPETGDITNITLWTMLVMGGMAALWMQLEQRKREQY